MGWIFFLNGNILSIKDRSELVNEVIEGGDTGAESLSGTDGVNKDGCFGALLKRIGGHLLPMGEDALREGTAGSGGTESLGESEGLGNGKEGLHVDERGSLDGVLLGDDSSTLGEALVDTTNGIIRALDLDEEDGLDESWGSGKLTGEEDTSGGGHDLATTSVDSIGVEGNILDVEPDSAHVLVGHNTLLGGPLESSLNGILDFVKVLNLLGGINDHVGAGGVWAEAPDLLGIIGIPVVIVLENSCSLLKILLGADLLGLDILGALVSKRSGDAVDSVMLVGGLREADDAGLVKNSLLVLDDWVTLLDWALGVLLLKILKADLNMELTASSDDVLTRLLSCANNQWVGLGELTESLNELGEIGSELDLDGDTHDGGDGVLHDLDAMSILVIRDGSLFHEVLIDSDESNGVTARDIGDGLDLTTHHEDGTLNVLDVKVVSGSWLVVGSHDSDLLASLNGTTEDTSESVESTLIVGGDHLGDEDHEGTVLITVLDGLTARIIDGSFVKHGSSVGLGSLGGGELHDDHFEEGLGGVDPLLENALEEILHALLALFVLEGDSEGLEHLPDGVKVAVHDVTAKLDDGSHDELDEASLELLAILGGVVRGERLGGGVEVVVTPELLHEALTVELELL